MAKVSKEVYKNSEYFIVWTSESGYKHKFYCTSKADTKEKLKELLYKFDEYDLDPEYFGGEDDTFVVEVYKLNGNKKEKVFETDALIIVYDYVGAEDPIKLDLERSDERRIALILQKTIYK